MSNNTNTTIATSSIIPYDQIIAAHFSLIVTVVGTTFNFITMVILCRAPFRNTKLRPVLHYMRVMAVFDTLMLYGWNIDHYLGPIHRFTIQRLNIPLCRFLSYFNYFAAQTSAWLRVFVCLDRYLSLSRLHKTWFSYQKNVLIIIGSILTVCTLINGLFFFYGCSHRSNGTITSLSWAFSIYPLWDYVNLAVYNLVPFVCMVILNSGVIYHLTHLKRTSMIQNSNIPHQAISVTLVITTFLFLIMTVPVTVGFAFFSTANVAILRVLDGLLYTYHALSFPLYMTTFDEFRMEFVSMIKCKKRNLQVRPSIGFITHTGNITTANK